MALIYHGNRAAVTQHNVLQQIIVRRFRKLGYHITLLLMYTLDT